MLVQFITEGGIAYFPGLSKPILIDAQKLPPKDAAELQRLVEAAHFFELPVKGSPPPQGAADYYTYTITIEEKGLKHTIHVNELVKDPHLQSLLTFLKAKADEIRDGD